MLRNFLRSCRMFKYESRFNKVRYYCSGEGGGAKIKDPAAEGVIPSDFQKKMLVWTGKFKNAEEIPPTVSRSQISQAESKMRIRTSNILMLLTLVACLVAVVDGKKKADRGETVMQMNRDFHKEYNSKMEASDTKQ